VPQRDEPRPPRDPQLIIDAQARRIAELEADLRRSEAERQRLRRENEKLKDELEAARRAVDRQAAPFAGRAEHALRPAVVTRKMCGGGNRTRRGADSQQVIASVLRTADQRGLDATDVLVSLLTAPTPIVAPALRATPAVH
jgi:hypothetical protein